MKLSKILLTTLLLSLVAFTGCASKTKKTDTAAAGTESISQTSQVEDDKNSSLPGALELNGDSDSNRAGGLATIYFPYNSASLSNEAQSSLEKNSNLLKAAGTVEVQIEGHCDERGGVQYNLALGAKRAETVKKYLTSLGVDARRITTISFGKERPLSFSHDEESWGQNRRANFVITAK